MENEKNQAPELSIQKYAIARLLLYITLLAMIVVFFIPILPIGEYAKISAFQFYTIDFSWLSFVRGLSSLWITVFRIAGIIGGLCMALAAFLTRNPNVNRYKKAFNTAGKQANANRMYIEYIYRTLPRGPHALLGFLFTMFCMASVGTMFCNLTSDNPSSSYTATLLLMLTLIFGGILIKNPIASLICAKDIRLINEESARFNNEKIESPTIISDFHFIGMLFGANESSSNNQNVTDVTEALRKYKKLLDDGIITEEEFQAKKAELLNTGNDQKAE